jgi:phosphoribosylformylglycinamidine synthase II/phosphoribosylformylglycinamidine synthase I
VETRNLNQPNLSSPAQIVTEQPIFRIEVQTRKQDNPPENSSSTRLTNWRKIHLYFLQGDLTDEQVRIISQKLLTDPVTESFTASPFDPNLQPSSSQPDSKTHTIDITLLPGVTDPAAENLVHAAQRLGFTELERAATGQRYVIQGDASRDELHKLATERFSNPVIQRYEIDQPIAPPFVPVQHEDDTVEIIALTNADDAELLRISAERRLALDLAEMQAIRTYFQGEKREPTDVELEMLAQTWSEHCVHKTFKAKIDYTGPEGQITIDGLLNTYIRAATEKVNKPWVRSAFVDNAGIIAFDDEYDLAFKVETHNHPSALEPFGGANTGVGGVVRDILGVSARPIANTDILCFGPPDLPEDQLPAGVLHPNRIAEGVIHGIEDYGNKMGIPTVNGAIVYHPGYTSNPLVFCGCLGILPRGSHPNQAQAGDYIVVIGGRTGRDGLRGATFSSMEMDQTTGQIAGSAVQIGHPIQEKQVQEVVLRTRDEKLYHAITDCGAGGLSSAVGEMTAKIGGRVQLADVPLKYPGLRPWEIWLSEAQERMVFAVPPENWSRFQEICDGQDVEAVNIGTYEATGRLELFYGEKVVGSVSTEFLHDGIPQRHLKAEWKANPLPLSPSPLRREGEQNSTGSLSETLLKLLAHPNIRSKEDVIRRYDHEVQAGLAVKPLVGVDNHGPADAAVIVPLDTIKTDGSPQRGVAIANGICPLYGEVDPYAMAWAAIDEAIRNLVAVGANPDQIAILDNFCWGNPTLPDRLGALVRCAQGCHDAAVVYGVPFISGKDSLNNEYTGADGRKHAIPGTLLISAIGIVPDVNKTVTMDLKAPGNFLYVIGETRDEMGGSHYNLVNGVTGDVVPQPNLKALETYRALHKAIQSGLVVSCHDASEGGIAAATAEMNIAGRLGVSVDLYSYLGDDVENDDDNSSDRITLFSETTSRFIIEVRHSDAEDIERTFGKYGFLLLGEVSENRDLFVQGYIESELMNLQISDLEQAWRGETRTRYISSLQTPNVEVKVPSSRTVRTHTGTPKILILHANGSNRDRDAFLACELAGSEPEIVHVNQLISGERKLPDYHMLVVPGGFSYGDDLGAGKLWALELQSRLDADVKRFVDDGRPVIGICNGFQTLVKAGLLPGNSSDKVTLTFNEQGHFECRWVYLQPNLNSPCLFTEGLTEPIYCPVAHGEGRIAVSNQETLDQLWKDGLAALTYTDENGQAAGYPYNPNGSAYNIAGLCNEAGNVFGLMPHPEDHIFPWQHPRWRRADGGMDGLRLFKNGVKYA